MAKRSEQPPRALTRKQLSRAERESRTQRWVIIGFSTVAVLIIGILAYAQINAQYLLPSRSVATIGNDKITVGQLQDRIKYDLFVKFGAQSAADLGTDFTTVGNFVLTSMVDEVVIRQKAQEQGITVTDAEIDRQEGLQFGYDGGTPEPTATSFPTDFPTRGAPTATSTFVYTQTPTATIEQPPGVTVTPTASATATPRIMPTATPSPTPQPTSTPITLDDYNKSLDDRITTVSTTTGLSKDRVKELLRESIRNSLYREKLQESLNLTPDEEKEVAHVAHILVDTQEEAQAIIDRIDKGEEFSVLAAELSKDTSNAYNGGDLGWINKGEMVPEFEDAAFSIPAGELSSPVQTQYGWHIVKVYARSKVPATAQDKLQQQQEKFSEMLTQWHDDLGAETDPLWFTYITGS